MAICRMIFLFFLTIVVVENLYSETSYENSVFSLQSIQYFPKQKTRKLGTAFYIGDGRFVTNFHTLVYKKKGGERKIIIKYKDTVIYIDKILHYDSLFDLVVLGASEENIDFLESLEVISSKESYRGDSLIAFDYDYNLLVNLSVSSHEFIQKEFEVIILQLQNLKLGMSGSPLLLEDKVIGILWGKTKSHGILISSLVLSNLLKSKEVSCSIEECINEGILFLREEAQNDNLDAQMRLNIYFE